MLATVRGLQVGDPLTTGRHLYGSSIKLSANQGGVWLFGSSAGTLDGYAWDNILGPQRCQLVKPKSRRSPPVMSAAPLPDHSPSPKQSRSPIEADDRVAGEATVRPMSGSVGNHFPEAPFARPVAREPQQLRDPVS